MQVLILAGGRGTRMQPLTDAVPASMLYLPGGTVLDYLLHQLTTIPTHKRALVLQYRGDQIARYLSSRRDLHLIPQYAPFNRLGALASAANWVTEPTLVLFGNTYFSTALSAVLNGRDMSRPTFFLSSEDFAANRADQTNAFILPPEAFHLAKALANHGVIQDLIDELQRGGDGVDFVELPGWSRRITTPTDLLAVNRFLLTRWHEAMHPPEAGVGYDAMNFNWIAPDAEVDDSAGGLFVTIGPRAQVSNSRLYNALVLPGVSLNRINTQDAVLAETSTSLLRLHAMPSMPNGYHR